MEKYRLELYHHGTKGMKWGRRLYQRKDGSLTALGRLRYGKKGIPDTEAKKAESVETRKQKVLASRSAKVLDKNADLFDDQELNRAYQRLALEKRIRELEPPSKSKIETLKGKADRASDFINSGSKFYDSIAKIRNAFSKGKKPWPLINADKKDGDKKKDKDKKKDDDQTDRRADVGVDDDPLTGTVEGVGSSSSGREHTGASGRRRQNPDIIDADWKPVYDEYFTSPVTSIVTSDNVHRGIEYLNRLSG